MNSLCSEIQINFSMCGIHGLKEPKAVGHFCGASEAKCHIGITLSVIRLSLCLSRFAFAGFMFCGTLVSITIQSYRPTLLING